MSDIKEEQVTGWDDDLIFDLAIDPFNQLASSEREAGRIAGRRAGYREGLSIGRLKGWEIGLELGYVHGFATEVLNAHRYSQAEIGVSTLSLSAKSESGDGHDAHINENSEDTSKAAPKLGSVNRSSHRIERCLTLSRDLVKMISDFPDPETLLLQNDENEAENETSESSVDVDDDHSNHKAGDICLHQAISTKNRFDEGERGNFHESETTNGKNSREKSLVDTTSMADVTASIQRIRAKFKLLCVLLQCKQQFELRNVLDSSNADPILMTQQTIGKRDLSGVSGLSKVAKNGDRDNNLGDQMNSIESKRIKNNNEVIKSDW
mmetsp:Transcript_30887/g.61573  ORF Transcript_30887/g.61573 Transcript_30887/m.61573 type:complete len:322 (-) Transcript_30887:15-980(-)